MSDSSTLPTRLPPGTVVPWLGGGDYVVSATSSGTLAAPGWLYCDGTLVDARLYPALAAAITGVYGTAPANYFYLPSPTAVAGAAPLVRGAASGASRTPVPGGHTHNVTTTVNVTLADGGGHAHTAYFRGSNDGNTYNRTTTSVGGSSHTHDKTYGEWNSGGSNYNPNRAAGANLYAAGNDHTHYVSGYDYTNKQWQQTPAGGGGHDHSWPSISVGPSNTHTHAYLDASNFTPNASAAATTTNVTSPSAQPAPPYVRLWHLIKT